MAGIAGDYSEGRMTRNYLYIISEGPSGPIKIGRSVNPWARAHDLQCGNSRPIAVFLTWEMSRDEVVEAELMLHDELKKFRMESEWFDLTEEFIGDYMPDFFGANGYEASAS